MTAKRLTPLLLLVAAVALLYGHALWNPLVFDDKPFFSVAGLHAYGTSLFHLDLRWFPYASFGWTYELFGLDWFWYRLGNLCLHALTSVFLFLFLLRLQTAVLKTDVTPTYGPAFFGALLFALHPVAVYGAAYLVQRSIIMATLFSLVALLCYLHGLLHDKTKWYLASVLFYFLAVFSKEHSVMLPGIALTLTLLLHKPSFALVKKLWLPYTLYLAIAVLILLRAKGLLGTPYEPFAAEMLAHLSEQQPNIRVEHAYGLSVITQGYLFFKYLLLWILPYPGWLSVDLRQAFATQFLAWPQLAGFILFLAYPVLALRLLLRGGRMGLLGCGLLFPWILYLTELSAVRIQEPFVLYRSYLWMSGLPVVLLALPGNFAKKATTPLLLVWCVVLAAVAWNRLDTFSSSLKLWSDAAMKIQDEKLPGAARPFNNRGTAYLEADRLQQAQEDFTHALAINPEYPEAHLNTGIVNFRQHLYAPALQSYDTAITLRPDYSDAYMNRGVLYLQTARYTQALAEFENMLRLDPHNPDAYLNRGIALFRLGRTQEAMNDLDEVLHLDPRKVSAYVNRATLDATQGHADSALNDLDRAAQIDPADADVYYNRGLVHGILGRYAEAMQDYEQALRLKPDFVDAYVNRGGLYLASKRLPEALADFEQALRLDPNQENAYLNRANVFATQKRYQEALDDYERTLKLNPRNGNALLNRGFVLLTLNRKAEAQASFRASCDAGNRSGCDRAR